MNHQRGHSIPHVRRRPSRRTVSKPPLLASLSETPSRIPTIPPSPPPAPATPPTSSPPKKSPTSSASTSAPPPSTAAITPSTSTPHFEFGLENVSRQFVWSFLHAHPFYNSEQQSQRYVRLDRAQAYIPPSSLFFNDAHRAIYEQAIAHAWNTYRELSSPPGQLTPAPFSATSGTSAPCPTPSASKKSSAPPKNAPSKSPVTFSPSPLSPRWFTPSPASSFIASGA